MFVVIGVCFDVVWYCLPCSCCLLFHGCVVVVVAVDRVDVAVCVYVLDAWRLLLLFWCMVAVYYATVCCVSARCCACLRCVRCCRCGYL